MWMATQPPGAIGSTGPLGATGVDGSTGPLGAIGSTGPLGATGVDGSATPWCNRIDGCRWEYWPSGRNGRGW